MLQKERAGVAANNVGSSENLEVCGSSSFVPDYTNGAWNVQSLVTLDEFLSAFYPTRDEEIRLRGFKAKGAPKTPDNYPDMFGITRALLANDFSLRQRLLDLNSTRGLYFGVNAGGDKDTDITRFNAWFVESDDLSIEAQYKLLECAPILPSIIVKTRKSLHAYWLVTGGCDSATWKEIQRRLIDYFHGDEAIKNPSRVMRLPYFKHLFYDKETGGIVPTRVELVAFHASFRYTVQEMLTSFPPVAGQPQMAKADDVPRADVGEAPAYANWEDLNAELRRRIMRHPTASMSNDGWFHCQGICHDGNGDTAIMFNPATGAVKCMAGCSHKDLLRAFGLPEQPSSRSSNSLIRNSYDNRKPHPTLNDKALHG